MTKLIIKSNIYDLDLKLIEEIVKLIKIGWKVKSCSCFLWTQTIVMEK